MIGSNNGESMNKTSSGVVDWTAKLQMILRVLNVMDRREVVDKVAKTGCAVPDGMWDSIYKWDKSKPGKKASGFLLALIELMKFKDGMTIDDFINARADRFFNLLSPDSQVKARHLETFALDRGTQNIMTLLGTTLPESVKEGVRTGRVTAQHFYLAPDDVNRWNRLIDAQSYPTYTQCKAGLQVLVESPEFHRALEGKEDWSVVMLGGGGSATKDLVIMNQLLHSPANKGSDLHYTLVDVSPFMLMSSKNFIDRCGQEMSGFDRVIVHLVVGDVLEMTGESKVIRQSGNVIFGITGGTIGNLHEGRFFNRLGEVSKHGDILILSADTLEPNATDAARNQVLQKYDNQEVRRFISPYVQTALSEFHPTMDLKEALQKVKVSLRDGKSTGLSQVPGTTTVSITIPINGRDVHIANSTRYSSDQLVEFAERYGWREISRFPSPHNHEFVQFLLRREGGS